MSDTIDRQAAIDEAFEIYMDGQKFEVVQVETLMGLPPAQPEITRCKDCVYSRLGVKDYGQCEELMIGISGSDFCSRAERRQNDVR